MDKSSLDLSNIPKEIKILLQIMSENNISLSSLKNVSFSNIDWELFLQLAEHHRVVPLIYSKMKKINHKGIPSHVTETLYKEYKKNTFQMLNFSGEMEQVSKLFTENQIRLLFLKGPIIAADLYGDISLRTSKDLDILIQKKDLTKAEQLLLNFGYVKEENLDNLDEWKWMNHHLTFFHPQKKVEIEIHWRLHPPPTKVPSFNELWNRKRISPLTSYPVYFFGKEDLFLYLIAHGAKHGWFRLRWLADIDQIIRKRIISEKDILMLKNYQNQHLGGQAQFLIGQALLLSSQLLKTPIHEEMQTFRGKKRSRKLAQLAIFYITEKGQVYIKKSKDACSEYPESHSIKSNLKKSFIINRYLFSIKSNLQKFIFVIKLLFPSSADEETLRLPKPLYFLYLPLHPLLWFWRKTR
ncbi:Renal dipeptidase [Bacillus sp. AFS026049]|uniref:nucleotidyltransferase domain-containing protein n=1 Tax=Peribacillus frigoritolerans TaxID=450367 RepID=UPI000BF4679B|nr:Renal dipeptidase [Bacillus sp. AFS026049]